MRELIVDCFAGGGGASVGLERACGRVDVAINHDPIAVAMHQANHPRTHHMVQNINAVDPREATQGRPVGLLWCSPDCTHHSKASGRKPRSKRLRDLPKVMVHWAQLVRPRIICMENVEEIQQWGPLCVVHPKGTCSICPECEKLFPPDLADRPCPDCKGIYWARLVGQLVALGYEVEYCEKKACDYGAPTLRNRLFMVARCDGEPIIWPSATHGPGLTPYRVAAECIDWSVPSQSIFDRAKPLVENTMRRIARGVWRYVLNNENPFIVRFNQNGIGQSINEPLDTVMAGATRFGLVTTITHHGQDRNHSLEEPFRTITCAHRGEMGLVSPVFVPHHGEREGQEPRCMSADAPMATITPQNNPSLVQASFMAILRNNADAQSWDEPFPTLCASGTHFAEVRAFCQTYYGTDQDTRLDQPLPTITTKDRFGVVTVKSLLDIYFRMLVARELFNAQDFPRDYIIDPITEYVDKRGRRYMQPITKTDQVRCVGNSVPPCMAYSLAAANYVEMLQPASTWSKYRRPRKQAVGQGSLL